MYQIFKINPIGKDLSEKIITNGTKKQLLEVASQHSLYTLLCLEDLLLVFY